MITTKFYLDRRMKAKDGKGNIVLLICYNRTSSTIPTGIRVLPKDWDGTKIVNLPDAMSLNVDLIQKRAEINKSITLLSLEEDLTGKTAVYIKNRIQSEDKREDVRDKSVKDVFEEYMPSIQKDTTRDIYRITLKKVLDFSGRNIGMSEINYKWLVQFDSYLAKTQSVNGKAIYLRALKRICNYARLTNVISTYPFDRFHIKLVETKKRSVLVDKFREFMNYPTTARNAMFRDYFMLMFYLIGINVIDLVTAKKSAVVNGRLEYVRHKTGKKYSIKIEPEAAELLKKYEGKGDYLIDVMEHYKHYKSFLKEVNKALRKIGPVESDGDLFENKKIVPIVPGLTTYFARHTWATLASEIDLPIDTISQALGHPVGNKTTLVYVRYDMNKVDEANRKVIDYLSGK